MSASKTVGQHTHRESLKRRRLDSRKKTNGDEAEVSTSSSERTARNDHHDHVDDDPMNGSSERLTALADVQ
jgi:hypothetical protein